MFWSDRRKTLIRIVKDYDKFIVFRDCQMHFLKYLFEKKGDIFIFFIFILVVKINRYWTTFETLAEIERDWQERQLNSAWEVVAFADQCHESERTKPSSETKSINLVRLLWTCCSLMKITMMMMMMMMTTTMMMMTIKMIKLTFSIPATPTTEQHVTHKAVFLQPLTSGPMCRSNV